MNFRSAIPLFAAALVATAPVWAAPPPDAVAEAALTRMRKLVTPQNYALMGFSSSNEIYAATLNKLAFDVHQVRFDKLKTYVLADDPKPLIEPASTRIYPVTVLRETRSSITLGRYQNDWKPVAYGNPNLARLLTDSRAALVVQTHLAPENFFVVQLRALNAVFLAYTLKNQLILSPIVTDPSLNLVAGTTNSAAQVFATIVPMAQQQNPGLPR